MCVFMCVVNDLDKYFMIKNRSLEGFQTSGTLSNVQVHFTH